MNTLLNLVFFNEFLDECITKCLVKLNIIWYYFEIFGIFSKYLVMHQIWGILLLSFPKSLSYPKGRMDAQLHIFFIFIFFAIFYT